MSNTRMEHAEYALMDAAEQGMWWYRALHARLESALSDRSGRVLDAGCGTGGLLKILAQNPSLHPIGLEYSALAAPRAAAKSGVPVVRGNVNFLPFDDASFDAAVSADVLCHMAVTPPAALAELHRVLRPGGMLVVNMPAFAWMMSAHDRRVQNARRVNALQLQELLAEAGFVEISTRYWNTLLLPLMILQRKLRARGEARSDVAAFPPWQNAILHAITVIERMLPLPMPAGGSVMATAIRP